MTTETLANRIQRIRTRLAEIEAERVGLPEDNFERRVELQDEVQTLEARLAELKDEATNGVGYAEAEAGDASDYERVPDLGEEARRIEQAL